MAPGHDVGPALFRKRERGARVLEEHERLTDRFARHGPVGGTADGVEMRPIRIGVVEKPDGVFHPQYPRDRVVDAVHGDFIFFHKVAKKFNGFFPFYSAP